MTVLLSNWAMNHAASEIRGIAASMTNGLSGLGHPATWSGDDADKFQRDWNDLVLGRLNAAANKLDGIDFKELLEGFNG